MIFGGCPNCDAGFAIPIAPKCPAIEEHKCEECGKWIFTMHSRLSPYSYGEGDSSEFPKESEK